LRLGQTPELAAQLSGTRSRETDRKTWAYTPPPLGAYNFRGRRNLGTAGQARENYEPCRPSTHIPVACDNMAKGSPLLAWTTLPPDDSGQDVNPGQQRLARRLSDRLLEASRLRNHEVTT